MAEDTKEILKEALKEWLDEKFASFGKWAFGTMAAALFCAMILFWIKFGKF